MSKVRLLTREAPSARGGIGRYVDAIRKTLPDRVEVVVVGEAERYPGMVGSILADRREVWVHHILPLGTAAWMARVLRGPEYVVFLHGMDFDRARRNAWKRWLAKRILRNAKRVVANSSALSGEVAAFAGIARPIVVYPCVSDKLVELADTVPERAGVSSPDVRLLTVARLVERKGHCKVLEAMKDMHNVSYDIVGTGPMHDVIVRKIAELGLTDRVRMHTDVADDALAELYRQADIFVMPATKSEGDREGFGIVYLEANLFGLPVVACRTPGVDEAVVNGETGVLIEDTSRALREALAKLVSDATLRTALGRQGRERVLAEFTRERQFATLRNLL